MATLHLGRLGRAVLQAALAAPAAILAEVGLSGPRPDLAAFLRRRVAVPFRALRVTLRGEWTGRRGVGSRAGLFLVLSGRATGASRLCCFRALSPGPAAQVAPVARPSVVPVAIFGVALPGERLTLRKWPAVGMIAGGVLPAASRG
jgi:transporter family protein